MGLIGTCLGLGFLVIPSVAGWAGGPGEGPALGKFRNTHYYLALESDSPGAAEDVILTPEDEVIARVSGAFRKAVDIEGSGKLVDGRVINFAGRKNGRTRYRITRHAYGRGVGDCALVPFHTIAVDPNRVPLGSLIRIDETVGMELPDGSRHDGLWRAEDIGSAIQRDRVDLFIGENRLGEYLERAGITHLMPLTFRLVAPPEEGSCVDRDPTR